MMSDLIALAQCASGDDISENLRTAEDYMKSAGDAGASMIVFPEYMMIRYSQDRKRYVSAAQPLDGPFVTRMGELSKKYRLWSVFGMNECSDNTDTQKSYNTLVVLDCDGDIRGCYRKIHLFDAFSWKESDVTIAGKDVFVPIDTPVGVLGLGTCYDLRFPALARWQARQGAQIFIYPSAWVKGSQKDVHWKTLLCARAIENGMFVLGCSQYTSDIYLGQSCAFDPMGRLIAAGGSREELILVPVDKNKSTQTRKRIPTLTFPE